MKNRGRKWFIISYLAPALIIYLVLVIWPLIQAFQFSFYQWSGLSDRAKFIGTDNFKRLWKDGDFWNSLKHNLWLFFVSGSIVVIVSIIVAHLLTGNDKSSKSLRGIVLFPQMLSLTIVAILWGFMFNPQFGLVNGFLNLIGLHSWNKTWLGKPETALAAVGVAFIWYAFGFYSMLFAAGIRGLPTELGEAASLDGATGWVKFSKITWPNLWSIKRIVYVHLLIAVLNSFVLIYLMTNGGPDRATDVLLTYLYEQAFSNSTFGYATSIAVANFLVAMVMTVVILKLIGKDPTGVVKT